MLPWQQRLYFWGVHGIFAEVLFTAVWGLLASGPGQHSSWALMGQSSAWSFLTYGLGTFLLAEPIYRYLVSKQVPLLSRLLFYVLATYAWEFSCGVVLTQMGACPWDYSDFTFNFKGLITLEYAPFWAIAGAYFELVLAVMATVETVPRWKRNYKQYYFR